MNLKAVLEGLLFLVGDEGIDMKDICDILENYIKPLHIYYIITKNIL